MKDKLTFHNDDENPSFFNVFGIDNSLAEKLTNRLDLFLKEESDEIKEKLLKAFGSEEEVNKMVDQADDDDASSIFEITKAVGYRPSRTGSLERFLQSTLFETLSWKPKTINDHFVLGYIYGKISAKNSIFSSIHEATEMVQKVVNEKTMN